MLSNKAVEEFREIYIRKVGELISFEEAKIKAENFIQLFKLISTPPSKQS